MQDKLLNIHISQFKLTELCQAHTITVLFLQTRYFVEFGTIFYFVSPIMKNTSFATKIEGEYFIRKNNYDEAIRFNLEKHHFKRMSDFLILMKDINAVSASLYVHGY